MKSIATLALLPLLAQSTLLRGSGAINEAQLFKDQVAAELDNLKGGSLSITWSDCGDADTHGKVESLTPDTMTLGEKTTITGNGNIDEAITGGTFSIHLSAFMVSETYTGDICEAKTFDM